MSRSPRIVVAGMGGTIASVSDDRGHAAQGLHAADILASIPSVAKIAEIVPRDVRRISSWAVAPADVYALAHDLRSAVEEGCDGIVVTHGTDTLKEAAYALSLQLDLPVPLVLTGAMRLPHATGRDGPANLLAAVQVAATPTVAALGPVGVLHDEVHLARWVTKTHTARVAAFVSPESGPVGQVVEGQLHLSATRVNRDHLGLPPRVDGRVELIWVAAGAYGLLVDVDTERAGDLVVAGTGGGHVPPPRAAAVGLAAAGTLVILTSRCGVGPVLRNTYGGPGPETDLRANGVLPAGRLSPLKARLRLLIALALGCSPREVFPA
jgi:L-asparaginase